MKKTLFSIALVLTAFPAFATYPTNNYNTEYEQNQLTKINNQLQQGQGQLQGQGQKQKQNQGQGQGQQQGMLGFNGSKVTTGDVTTNTEVNMNQAKQVAAIWLNGYGSQSQDSCASSVGAGGGAGGGNGSILFPWESDSCNGRKDAQFFYSHGMALAGCKRFIQDEDNAQAMKDTNMTCEKYIALIEKSLNPVVVEQPVSHSNVPSNDQWSKMDMQRDIMINEVMAKQRRKH